jgi:uncharacterized repeat protein (TIGR01451 family)
VPALVLAPLLAVAVTTSAQAATGTGRSFGLAFSRNVNGDIAIAANTLMTCTAANSGAPSCASVQAGTAKGPNNDYTMGYVDVDGDPATFNSSTATLTVPSGATVLYALLVWGGRLSSGNAASAQADQASFLAPGASRESVTASTIDWYSDSNGEAYQASADVTAQVAAAGTGTHAFTVGNVQSQSGGNNQYAGWSMVVALSDPSQPARNLSVFTGLTSVKNGAATVDIGVSGFLTPDRGAIHTTIGVVAYEGDDAAAGNTTYIGDQLLVSRASPVSYVNVGDAVSPSNNVFNSTVGTRGTPNAGRTPSYANQLGFDADLISADGILGNSDTSAKLRLTTSGEQYYPGVVTFATELYDPKLNGAKTVTDVDGGSLGRGDELLYTVPVRNDGLDSAASSRFFDAIPTGTTYVPGSITVDGTPVSDAADGDAGAFVPPAGDTKGHVSVDLGTIPVTATGDPAPHTVTFRVTVDPSAVNGQPMVNGAALTYRGLTTHASSSSVTNTVSSVVDGATNGTAPSVTPDLVSFEPSAGTPAATIPVLANDTATGALTVVGVTDAAGGTVVVNPDGTLGYTPRAEFAGRDVFTYTVCDPQGNVATTTVQVEVVNTAPTAVADATSTGRDVARVVGVLGNDTDANGDTLAVRGVDATSAHGGTVALSGGMVTYTPPAGYVGTDTFDYVVEDTRGGSDSATVTVTITNTAPVAVDDAYATTAGVAASLAVLGNDSDANGDALTAILVGGPGHGTLTLNADGTGTYTPTPGWVGTDTFTYRVSDGSATSALATVSVKVNGAPVAVDDTATTPTGVAATIGVRGNDSDPNTDPISLSAVTAPAHGSVVIDAGGTVTYTPAAGFAGSDSFDYTITDGSLTATATVTVTVTNAAPTAAADTASTPVDTPAANVAVLANDTDPNIPGTSQHLSVTGATADHGASVTVGSDGTLTVTPAGGYSGAIAVTYTLSDGAGGTATGTLTVTVANGVPSAAADAATTPTDTSVLVDVLGNDSDPNHDALTVVPGSVTGPVDGHGAPTGAAAIESGRVRYTPPAGFAGSVTFDYTASDGNGGTATATVAVTVANAAPVGVADVASTDSGAPVTVDVLRNDTDANVPGGAQVLAVVGATADHGATVLVEADGRLTVRPAAGYAGPVTVTYTVSDGAGGTASATLTVTVRNAAPVAVPSTTVVRFGSPARVDLLGRASDANGDPLAIVEGSVSMPVDAGGTPRGTVAVVDGVATYTPPPGFSGTVRFTYTVTDGQGGTSTATATVDVGNAPPVATDDTARARPGTPVTIPVALNDSAPDGRTLTVLSVTQPARGGVVAVVDGAVVFTPARGFSGSVSFTYTVVDEQGGTATASVTVQVGTGTGTGTGALASTGAQAAGLAGLALAFVVGGLGLGWLARRRRVAVLAVVPARRADRPRHASR